eukprot:scaffold8808_cov26-Prasinocladus_malaysianus.AAC.1
MPSHPLTNLVDLCLTGFLQFRQCKTGSEATFSHLRRRFCHAAVPVALVLVLVATTRTGTDRSLTSCVRTVPTYP